MTGIELTEWQANFATAYFLMPPDAVKFGFQEVFKIKCSRTLPKRYSPLDEGNLMKLADLFSASKSAMSIRLEALGLMNGFPDTKYT